MSEEILTNTGSSGSPGEAGASSLLASPGERERWLDAMADMSAESERRYRYMNARIATLERSAGLKIPEEMRGFLLMLGLYIGIQLVLPVVIEMVERWRSSR